MAAPHTHDDGFQEIQLNSKQLVFLFMAATVVSAVIFLSGVMVGRGVRAERVAIAQAAALNEVPEPDAVPSSIVTAETSSASTPSGGDPTTAVPPSPVDEFSYPDRLDDDSDASEDIRPTPVKSTSTLRSQKDKPLPALASAKASAAPAKESRTKTPVNAAVPAREPARTASASSALPALAAPAAVPALAPATAAASATSPTLPAGAASADGFAVQVAAVNGRTDADAIVKRLTSKGYSAYVQSPSSGTNAVYRVRVGTFKTRRDAEVVAARLQSEEQFKPWITR